MAIILFGWLALNGSGQTNDPAAATRDRRWQEDLNFFETNLPQKHIAFYQLLPRGTFEAELADLSNSVPRLSDQQIMLHLVRLMASLGVAHSGLMMNRPRPLAFHAYPLAFHWFSDGLAVVAAAPEYQAAIGTRVLRLGTRTPEQLEDDLTPYISHENQTWLREQSQQFMRMVELLQSLQIADTNGELALTLAKPNGKPFTLFVSPAKTNDTLITAQEILHFPVPLYRKHNGFYWYEYLPDSKALYIQYDSCQNDPKKPFKEFARELFAFADTNQVERTIVDLRFNGGGDSSVIDPLMKGIRIRPAMNAQGHLFVLTGPMTFSSGEDAVEEFHNSTGNMTSKMVAGFYWIRPEKTQTRHTRFNAVLIGEPTGGKPNCFGEVKTFELPNSKLEVVYPVKYFQLAADGDPSTREPDIKVTRSFADYLAGRDPVLEAALHFGSP
jgi:hypothetical protein